MTAIDRIIAARAALIAAGTWTRTDDAECFEGAIAEARAALANGNPALADAWAREAEEWHPSIEALAAARQIGGAA